MAPVMAKVAATALLVFACTVGAASTHAAAAGHSVAAVQKVIQMLTDMSATGKKEKKDEEVAFATFSTWCTQETASLGSEIGKNAREIETLEAEIGSLESDVKGLSVAIATTQDNVATHEANKKAETNQRARDHEDFLAEAKDYSESVDALDRAIQVLQEQNFDRTGAKAALLQVSGGQRLPAKARALVQAFAGMLDGDKAGAPDFADYEAPEANAYEFQSGGIVSLLKRLRAEFTSKLGQTQKEEMNSKHAYNMVVNDLTDAIENSEKDIQEKTVEKQRKAEKAGLNKKELAATNVQKAQNEETLMAAQTECREKKLSFQEKQKLRAEEIEAIEKAVEILASPEVYGHAETYLSLAQRKPAGAALPQLAGSRAVAAEGLRLHSQRLGLLAEQVSADPFKKVKKMIDSMITRLQEEANEDANHEGWCDTEVGKSKITRTRLSEEIDGLTAAVDDGKATIMKLTQTIATLSEEVSELVKTMGEATVQRKAEKKTNAQTVEDAKQAQKAVQAATAVLKEFYSKALTATALVQGKGQAPVERRWGLKMGVKMGSEEWNALAKPGMEGTVDKGHKEGMQTFGKVYQGQQQEEEYGVLALLELIGADFAGLEASTAASEEQSQTAFEQFMIEAKKSKATKERKIEMNTADKAAAGSKLRGDTADLKATQDELLAADRYHSRLMPQCMDRGMTFEERTRAREEEVASLKKALELLSGEDIATSVF
eukprot:CAMPEP_0168451396 /NCGR_PEP_ID=MMETSP0228-20121227/48613_1 /TAXON_ID=133427 /ORGANISM="Protoceratium reticulatum, Strain CCCM 535 (=CCMP 1889)" /LENGTH=718 /DNA_ID=CAMNT_0008466009 /DNA_START=25 /DNA_END=2181 /DNA_ORIENTATION=+